MTTAETIYELVKTMPEEQASLVLKLAETLQKRQMEKSLKQEKSLLDFFGILKNSPSFGGDSVEIQRRMRSDWD